MEIIAVIYALALFYAFVLFKTNNAKVSISLQRSLLFGFGSAKEVFELEREVDEHFQIAFAFLILTLTWTYELEN